MKSLVLDEVTKSYKHKIILNKINMTFEKKGVFLLAGPNGSGKTTLLESIVGLRSFNSGTIKTNLKKDEIAFLFQENNLRKLSTVKEELKLITELYSVKESVAEIARKYQFSEYLNSKTVSLSGGTKRRILVAMTLMTNADLVILDEPASGLDTFNRKEIWGLIKRYSKEHIVIVSDHYLNQAAEYSEYVYMLHSGVVVKNGSVSNLRNELSEYCYISVENEAKNELKEKLNQSKIAFTERSTGQNFYFYIKVSEKAEIFAQKNNYTTQELSFEDGYLLYTGDESNA